MGMRCRYCKKLVSGGFHERMIHLDVCPMKEDRVVMNGHAYKVLMIFEVGATVDKEVLHYIDESAAEEAFNSIVEMPKIEGIRITTVKLYKPSARYSRR